MSAKPDSEDALESAVMDLLQSLGYEVVNAYTEINGGNPLGRATLDQVVLKSRLLPVLERLNPSLPPSVLQTAIEELLADHSPLTLANANAQIYALLKNGVKVTFKDHHQNDHTETVALIDWQQADRNDWLAVQQFWVHSQNGLYKRRADVVLFVNGLPLGLIELKSFQRNVQHAFNDNLRDYKDTIPHLFWYNAFIILSNGRDSRLGSLTSEWEHFAEWKRISDEQEAGRVSLETMLKGVCEPSRLLDLVENFTLFKQSGGGVVKYIARNHQYLGVNKAIGAVQSLAENRGRLGVFWHTQGSGKSYSMVFFAQKVLRVLEGNWTFLIVTDRQELDEQIYQNFADVGAIPNLKGKQRDIQAQSGEDLKRLLQNDNRYIFTLIQKFHTRDGEPYPILSERENIIVMTDEAHRSQYHTFATNMRSALPNAAFIGFTGTPLMMVGEEKTRQVFGEYVSIYDFKQSVDDGATVPLYYENRIPKLQLTNDQLNDDMESLLDQAMLDDAQESQLEREFRQEYQIITREPRQDEIARDIVAHYLERGFAGRSYHSKAMIVCVDKLTAVRMYHRVKDHWNATLATLESQLADVTHAEERATLEAKCQFMRETDMAVIISQAQNEITFFNSKGLDIRPHRQRMETEALDEKFKKPEDPLRLVFVCAMWMTGFDAPACSTIYLDKPMRNHTLMQTIARANRVFHDKQDGLIVDYIGVFRNLEKALAIYGTGAGGTASEGEMPVQQKLERVQDLRDKIGEAVQFCDSVAVHLDAIHQAEGFDRARLKNEAVEALLARPEITQQFFSLVRQANRLFKSILPDKAAGEFSIPLKLLNVLLQTLLDEIPDADISDVVAEMTHLLDGSVATEAYIIEADPTDTNRRVDLSRIDFEALRERFEQGYKHTATERLRSSINQRLKNMVRQNRTRMNYLETFQQMIEEYNAGSVNVDVMFERLLTFVKELELEEQRAIGEQLSEEELAIFDILTRPSLNLTDEERGVIKRIAQQLLQTLKHEKLVLDWRKHQQTRAAVEHTIKTLLDAQLPDIYESDLYDQKCTSLYRHIYESYFGGGKSIYHPAA